MSQAHPRMKNQSIYGRLDPENNLEDSFLFFAHSMDHSESVISPTAQNIVAEKDSV